MPHKHRRRHHRPRHASYSKCHIFGQEVTTCWITTCIGISTYNSSMLFYYIIIVKK